MARHCKNCTCKNVDEVVEYGVTWLGGNRNGEIVGPMTTPALMNAFGVQWSWMYARLMIRTYPVLNEAPTEWRMATKEEVTHWNNHIMAPFVLHRVV